MAGTSSIGDRRRDYLKLTLGHPHGPEFKNCDGCYFYRRMYSDEQGEALIAYCDAGMNPSLPIVVPDNTPSFEDAQKHMPRCKTMYVGDGNNKQFYKDSTIRTPKRVAEYELRVAQARVLGIYSPDHTPPDFYGKDDPTRS